MIRCLTLLLAAAAAAAAAPLTLFREVEAPSIAGKDSYAASTLVRLEAKGVPDGATYRWRVTPSESVDRADTAPHLFQFVAKEGTYTVELLAIKVVAGEALLFEATKVVKIGGGSGPGPGPKGNVRDAIGRIRFGSAGCTATVIHPRRPDGRWDIVSAAHCVGEPGQTGSIELKDGRTVALVVAVVDRRADLSWSVTQSKTIDAMPAAVLAKETPAVNVPIAHSGYGYDKPGNEEHGVVAGGLTDNGMLQMDLSVSSGDSGGGIYRRDNQEIVATVCCTQKIAGYARMYGGGCVRAWQLRPKGEAADLLEWRPAKIPEVITPEKSG